MNRLYKNKGTNLTIVTNNDKIDNVLRDICINQNQSTGPIIDIQCNREVA